MAIDGLVKAGSESKWGFAQEATFGTPLADSTSYKLVEGPMPSIDYGLTQDQELKQNGVRYTEAANTYTTEKGGTRVISFSDMIVRRTDLAELIYAVGQKVVEGAAGIFQKDYDIINTTTQPDFSANAGYFATIFIDNVLTARDQIFTSCILRSLTLSASPSTGDSRLKASGEWVSGFASSNSETLSGSPSFGAQNYYEFNAPSLQQIASNDVVVNDWSITYMNNAVRVGNDSSGDCQSYALSYDVTGSITTKYDTKSYTALVNWLAGTTNTIQLSVGSAGSAGYFDQTITTAQYTGNERGFAQDGQTVVLPFKGVGNAGSSGLWNLQVDDAVDQAW